MNESARPESPPGLPDSSPMSPRGGEGKTLRTQTPRVRELGSTLVIGGRWRDGQVESSRFCDRAHAWMADERLGAWAKACVYRVWSSASANSRRAPESPFSV